jgi:hypothetical protein
LLSIALGCLLILGAWQVRQWAKRRPVPALALLLLLIALPAVGYVLIKPGGVQSRAPGMARRDLGDQPASLPEGGRIKSLGGGVDRSDPALWAAFVLSGDIE